MPCKRLCRPRLAAACLLATLGLAWSIPAQSQPTAPEARLAMLNQLIADLPDEVYFTRNDAATGQLASRAASSLFEGLLLGGPRRVELRRQPSFSALLLTSTSARRAREVPWNWNAMLVATDVARGDVFAGPALAPPEDKIRQPSRALEPPPSTAGDPSLEALGDGHSAGIVWLDLPGLINLPPRSARLALRVISFDQVSNPCVVDMLTGDPVEGEIPVKQALSIAERWQTSATATGLTLGAGPATPALPGPGVAAALSSRSGAVLPLHVALRVDLSRQMRVEKPPPTTNPASGARLPAALIKATVLAVVKNVSDPFVGVVEVPIWANEALTTGAPVAAAFTVDLGRLLPARALQGDTRLYVLAGSFITQALTLPR